MKVRHLFLPEQIPWVHLSLPLVSLQDKTFHIVSMIIIIIIIVIIITRPRPAFGRLGLGGSSGGYSSHG